MKLSDIVKAVFEMNHINPYIYSYNMKSHDREIVRAKQESAYIIKRLFPDVVVSEIAPLIQMKRCNVVFCRQTVEGNMALYKSYGKKIERMVKILTALKNSEVNDKIIETSLPLGSVSVNKTTYAYQIVVTNSEGEKQKIVISDECYNALINAYNQLN